MIEISIKPRNVIYASINQQSKIDASLPESKTLVRNIYPDYDGATEIVPSQSEQIIKAKDFILRSDIKIAPIPSNYGRIEFDGAKLRIV